MTTPTLVAIHAHPDDESSKGAGTVARYSSAGVRCVLITATGGEAGDILNPTMDRPDVVANLAAIRLEELDEATKIIGYHRVELLGYRDSGMPDTPENHHPEAFVNVSFDMALEKVVSVIREERPQILIGYDEHRRYQHPDHLRVHDLGLAAFDAAADPQRFPDAGDPWAVSKLYAPVFRIERIHALHEAVVAAGLESPFVEWLERLEDETDEPVPELPLTQIEVSETLAIAREALRAHRTQVDPEGFWFQVPLEVVAATYPFEDFELLRTRVPVSEPEEDLFSGI